MSNRTLPTIVVLGFLLTGCGGGADAEGPWENVQLDENGWHACHQFGVEANRIGGQATAQLPPGPPREPLLSPTVTEPGMASEAAGVSEAMSALVDASEQPPEQWAAAVQQVARVCLDRGYGTRETPGN